MAVEPLAIRLRQGGETWGIPTAGTTHSVSLYADDLLIYVRDVTSDLSPIWTTLHDFAEVSGLRVNWEKSTIFPLSPHLAPTQIQIVPHLIGWSTAAPRYLGNRLCHTPEDLYEGNHRRIVVGLRSAIALENPTPGPHRASGPG